MLAVDLNLVKCQRQEGLLPFLFNQDKRVFSKSEISQNE